MTDVQENRSLLAAEVPVTGCPDSVHVLVAEDDENIRNMLSDFLKGKGYVVRFAKNGREAIQQVRSDLELQIVLLDVSMPEMGGLEALNAIMAISPHPAVIMLTAVADSAIASQAVKVGAFDYILKPFDFRAIESSVTACLSQAAYRKTKRGWKR